VKNGWNKIKPLIREKAAIIKLTRMGYSINLLSEFLGRSTSYIHKTVRKAIERRIDHFLDKRKLPHNTRLRCSSIRRRMLAKYFPAWQMWILGEGDKPP
jgi:hypothetical protein